MAQAVSIQNEDINSKVAGGTVSLLTASTTNCYNIYSSSATAISGAVGVSPDTTPEGFVLFNITLSTTFTLTGGGSFTLFGQVVAEQYLQSGTKFIVLADGGTYTVACQPSFLQSGFIIGSNIADGTIALTKLVNLASGRVIVGSGSNIPTAVAMSGDITISNTGATAIGANKVVDAMVATGLDGAKLSNGTVPLAALTTSVQNQLNTMAAQSSATALAPVANADVLTLYSVPIDIVAAQGAGLAIQATGGAAWLDPYNTTPYATNTNLAVKNAGATTPQLKITSFLATTTSTPRQFFPVAAGTGAADTQLLPNTALQLTVETGNPTAGDSDLRYIVFYRVLSV